MDLDFRAVYNKINDFELIFDYSGIFFRWIELLENCKLKNIRV